MSAPVYIGCDDSGFEAKQAIIAYLREHGIDYVDCGSDEEPSRYPYYAARVASAVSTGKAERGILICGSGIGMSIAANKFNNYSQADQNYMFYLSTMFQEALDKENAERAARGEGPLTEANGSIVFFPM